MDGLVSGGAEHADRHVDQPEAEESRPKCAGHLGNLPTSRTYPTCPGARSSDVQPCHGSSVAPRMQRLGEHRSPTRRRKPLDNPGGGWLTRPQGRCATWNTLPDGSRNIARRSPYSVSVGGSTLVAPASIARRYVASASSTYT